MEHVHTDAFELDILLYIIGTDIGATGSTVIIIQTFVVVGQYLFMMQLLLLLSLLLLLFIRNVNEFR
jgi:hypothetical protein